MRSFFRTYFPFRRAQPSDQAAADSESNLLIEIGQEVAQGLFDRLELDAFLQRFAESIERRFLLVNHVQIYVTQPGGQRIALRAATGSVGQKLLERDYEVDLGGLSSIGRVALTRSALVINDYQQEKILKPHALLAAMRSELALPLVVKGGLIGVFDAQSSQPNAFPPAEETLLRAVANQLTIAIDSLQLYEEAQRKMRENRALFQQTQTNLREIEHLNYQLTGRAWSEYLRLQPEAASMTLDLENSVTDSHAEWTETLNEAATQRQVITITQKGQRLLALPILVRNEVIGAMEFEIGTDDALPEGVLELAATVGQRLGLAMENRRLFDETQRAVQREALINDIGADLQAAAGVDVILQRAARHLQDTLAAHQVTIRLGAPASGDHKKR
jgi:GAF domain-containing protein